MCVYDKLSDTLPISTLKHCLGVVKKQHVNASQLAEIVDGYESNFFADGRYKGLLVTAGTSAMHGNQYHNNGQFVLNEGGGDDGSVRFRGMRGRGSNRGSGGMCLVYHSVVDFNLLMTIVVAVVVLTVYTTVHVTMLSQQQVFIQMNQFHYTLSIFNDHEAIHIMHLTHLMQMQNHYGAGLVVSLVTVQAYIKTTVQTSTTMHTNMFKHKLNQHQLIWLTQLKLR